ncbi:hypothetical protein KKH23_09940 [Patescibacteria group bacterium]|nr:hypothetical protein [Patescibacteria group bacterium]
MLDKITKRQKCPLPDALNNLGDGDFKSKGERAIYEQFLALWREIGELKGTQRGIILFLGILVTMLSLVLNRLF